MKALGTNKRKVVAFNNYFLITSMDMKMNNQHKLLKTEEIGYSVIDCAPHSIAVAYVGIDWKKFINISKLKRLIISPTIGTNPYAIESLVKHISWDRIFFLNNLHAKMYIGNNSAIVGSSNLSENGLSVSGLEEVAIETKDKTMIAEIKNYYKYLQSLAEQEYPTTSEKKNRLAKLKIIWSKAVRNSVITNYNKNTLSLQNYSPLSSDDFYIVWYQPSDDYGYSEKVQSIKDIIADEMHFAENDDIKVGKWILAWRITNKNKPHKRVHPHWIFIDDIFSKAISTEEEYDYTKIAIERNDRVKIKPPFELDKTAITAFNRIISTDKYAGHFASDPFLVKKTFCVFKAFIAALKNEAKTIPTTDS